MLFYILIIKQNNLNFIPFSEVGLLYKNISIYYIDFKMFNKFFNRKILLHLKSVC